MVSVKMETCHMGRILQQQHYWSNRERSSCSKTGEKKQQASQPDDQLKLDSDNDKEPKTPILHVNRASRVRLYVSKSTGRRTVWSGRRLMKSSAENVPVSSFDWYPPSSWTLLAALQAMTFLLGRVASAEGKPPAYTISLPTSTCRLLIFFIRPQSVHHDETAVATVQSQSYAFTDDIREVRHSFNFIRRLASSAWAS